jgi:hypothetical protein
VLSVYVCIERIIRAHAYGSFNFASSTPVQLTRVLCYNAVSEGKSEALAHPYLVSSIAILQHLALHRFKDDVHQGVTVRSQYHSEHVKLDLGLDFAV